MLATVFIMSNLKNTETAINEVVLKALEVAEKTGNFVIEQAPDLIQEFYTWHTYKHLFWVIFSLVCILSLLYPVKKALKKIHNNDENELDIIVFVVGLAIILIFVLVLFIHLYELIFIVSAPKLYIIEYFVR